jgi:hypothetical protein
MATTKSVLRLTESEAVVKVAGTAATEVIDLQVDLLRSTEELTVGGTQRVSISGVQWTGSAAGVITIVRGGVTVMTLTAAAAGALEMNGQMMIPDSTENASDISVAISGGQAEVWLRLTKVDGYLSKIETSEFSVYDDITKVGE